MPAKKPGESRSDYLKRCIPIAKGEGLTNEQAVGKCEGLYDSAVKKHKKTMVDDSFPRKDRGYPSER